MIQGRPRFRFTLTGKASILVSLLVVMTSVSLSIAFIQLASRQMFRRYIEDGAVLAQHLADESDYALLTRNLSSLEDHFRTLISSESHIYVRLLDADGGVASCVCEDPSCACGESLAPHCPASQAFDETPRIEVGTAVVRGGGLTEDGEELYEISVPIMVALRPLAREELEFGYVGPLRPSLGSRSPDSVALWTSGRSDEIALAGPPDRALQGEGLGEELTVSEQIGTLQLGLSRRELSGLIGRIKRTTAAFTLGVIVVGVLLTLTFIRLVLSPLKELAEAAEDIRGGDLSRRVHIAGGDEIGDLAQSFNQMLDRLQEWQRRLVQSERWATVGHFAGSLAHELRNPLGVIRNSKFFIESRIDADEKIKRHLDLIDQEVEMANTIVTGLLTFSRLSEPKKRPSDLNALVRRSVERAELSTGVRITLNLSGDLPVVEIDQGQVERVFVSIIKNADQAMEGTGTLAISTRSSWLRDEIEERDVSAVEIAFDDTGSGISREIESKIFEPLFSTKARGIGLGLSVAKAIVENHRGVLEVRKGVGRGARFVVTLPVSGLKDRKVMTGAADIGAGMSVGETNGHSEVPDAEKASERVTFRGVLAEGRERDET